MKKVSSRRIPPPLITIIFMSLMYLLNLFFTFEINFSLKGWLVLGFITLAVFFVFPAIILFLKNKTTVNPLKPQSARVLVVNGVYRFSRNPMYLAMVFILIAWGVWIGNPTNIVLLIGFIAYMNRYQISAEEEALGKIFKEDFEKYKRTVRRWI